MQTIKIIWALFWNLVTVAIYAGMLSVTNTKFETIVVAGLALIYVTILYYASSIVRLQMVQARMSVGHYIEIAKIVGDEEKQVETSELEEDTNETWKEYEKKNVIYYINMFFVFLIWLISVLAIISSL